MGLRGQPALSMESDCSVLVLSQYGRYDGGSRDPRDQV